MCCYCVFHCLCPEKVSKVAKAGKIPRYQRLQQKNKPLLKPVTPSKIFFFSLFYSPIQSL